MEKVYDGKAVRTTNCQDTATTRKYKVEVLGCVECRTRGANMLDLDPEAHDLREISRPCQVERIYVVENIMTIKPAKEKQPTIRNNGNVISTR